MSYIIASNTGLYVARRGPFDFKCADYTAPLYRVFGGRITAPGAVTFDTPAAARRYINNNAWLTGEWFIREYDPCMNCIKGAVVQCGC